MQFKLLLVNNDLVNNKSKTNENKNLFAKF